MEAFSPTGAQHPKRHQVPVDGHQFKFRQYVQHGESLFLAGMTITYLLLVELVKRRLMRRLSG
jgi:hypothetical protein